MTLNCIIIDDEPLARKGLTEYIAKLGFLQLVGAFSMPVQASNILAQQQVHLVFLDIQMPTINGLDFAKSIPNMPPVIFTTAYPNYAVEGFEVAALDYLVKPISFERFYKAVMRVQDHYLLRDKIPLTDKQSNDHFFIKVNNRMVKLLFSELLLVEGKQNYVCIYTQLHKYITYLTMKSLEGLLPSNQFLKVHKSFVVAVDKITAIEGNEIHIGTHRIPISRNFKTQVTSQLLDGKYLKR